MRKGYAITSMLAASLVALSASHHPAPRFVWNATASAPVGLYQVTPGSSPAIGDLVLVRPDPALGKWLARRHYVPFDVPLIKPVAARAGQSVCRQGARILLDGRPIALAQASDKVGRPLPVWVGCRMIGAHELLLLNAHVPDSLDSRYFGPVRKDQVIGTVHPLLTRSDPEAAFLWQGWRS